MSELRIAPDVALPIEFATEASAILARRGRGKTYTASVLAEELHGAGQPFVVLDPVGVWWGLRSSADGRSPGLDVKILGGEHSDVPLEEKTGTVLATFVVDHPAAYVIDLSGFESKAAQDRFVADFAERLYRYKAAQERRTPLTLIIDEADQFAPQRPNEKGGAGPRMLGALESIVRQGRARGLGCVLITQRPAVLNKNVLTQAGALVLLGITGPQDRDAVDDWIKGHAEPEQRKEVIGSLARLAVGEAWVWWPTEDLLQRVQVRERRTFDSSSTPRAGETREAVRFADVDLDALKDALAESVEKAKAEDPKLLQATIRDLRRELTEARAATPELPPPVEIEVPVLDEDTRDAIRMWTAAVAELPAMFVEKLDGLSAVGHRVLEQLEAHLGRQDVPRAGAAGGGARAVANRRGSGRAAQRPDPPARREPRRAAVPRAEAAAAGDVDLSGPERKILNALAQFDEGLDRAKLALLCNYHQRAKSFTNALGSLRSKGLVTRTEPLQLTDEGDVVALDLEVEPLPTGRELVDWWKSQPKIGGVAGRVLDTLYDHGPMTRDELAEALDYHPRAKSFTNAVGQVRGLGLVVGTPDQLELTEELAGG